MEAVTLRQRANRASLGAAPADHRNRTEVRPYRLEVHHPPWALESAEADITMNTMADAAGLQLPPTPPLLHFSKRQDALCWAPTRC